EAVPALKLRESLRPRRPDAGDLAGVELENELEAFPADTHRIQATAPGGVERECVRGHALPRLRTVAADHRPDPQGSRRVDPKVAGERSQEHDLTTAIGHLQLGAPIEAGAGAGQKELEMAAPLGCLRH